MQTGVPVVFVEASLDNIEQSYQMLGDLLNEEEKANHLGEIGKTIVEETKNLAATLDEEQKLKVYYGEGENGLQTNPPQSIHAEVLNLVGAINVADLEQTTGAGLTEVSIEQILQWDPDVIVFGPHSAYETVMNDPLWQDLRAVQDERVYEVPEGPYNWMGRPPAVNRLLGLRWMGSLLYPEIFNYDLHQEIKEFYKEFYHYELTDDQVHEFLKNSTEK